MKKLIILLSICSLTACTGIPEGIQPISNFELEQYLGRWHEIARLDHSFERGMQQVTATYEMREDGGVRVLNEGFLTDENSWDQAEGKAYLADHKFTILPQTAKRLGLYRVEETSSGNSSIQAVPLAAGDKSKSSDLPAIKPKSNKRTAKIQTRNENTKTVVATDNAVEEKVK